MKTKHHKLVNRIISIESGIQIKIRNEIIIKEIIGLKIAKRI